MIASNMYSTSSLINGNRCPNLSSWSHSSGWGHITDMVNFGDSLTDEGRLSYFAGNNGQAPPIGWVPSDWFVNNTASGGRTWPAFVSQGTGVKVHNFAVSGAACSNELTPRYWDTIHANFPDIMGYELPAFLEEFTDSTSGCPKLNPGTTAYTIWIGNNDLGGDALLSDSHTGTDSAPVSLTNVTSCITSVMESLYEKVGARYFILQNLGPIEKAPIYVDNGSYAKANRFWPTKEIQYMGNGTRIEERMRSMVWATNEILKYKVPVLVATKLKDASVAIFDSHGFIQDIMNRPEKYLTGPKPLNTTGYNVQCPTAGWDGCTVYRPDERASFLWYDEAHLSEEAMRNLAKNIVEILKGKQGPWWNFWTKKSFR